jgi:hypothetical protein
MSNENDPAANAKKAASEIGRKIDSEVRVRADSTGSKDSDVSRISSADPIELDQQLDKLKNQVQKSQVPGAEKLFQKLQGRKGDGQSPKIPKDKGPFGWQPK